LIVNYKEALVFAFLCYLRLEGRINTLSSVTGAKIDSIGGNLSGIVHFD
jgi:anhydro-N-acetylmuramic acid kinase